MADIQLKNIYDTVRADIFGAPIRPAANSSFQGSVDQFYLNCFPQSSEDPETGVKERWIVKRPGLEKISIDLTGILGAVNSVCLANIAITQLNDIYVAGIYDQNNTKMVICQYRPITGTTTKIGEITGVSGLDQLFISELTIAGVAYIGVVWNSQNGTTSKGYYAASAAGVFTAASLTEITDTDYPPKRASPLPTVGGMVQMNGTTYVMTNTGEICNSDLNSITSWNALGVVQAISYPDQGVGLIRYKNYLLAFGEDSIEFMADVGNPPPGSPLQRQEQAFIKFGAIHAKAIIGVDDHIYWLGRSSSGSVGLWKLEGFTPTKISGPVQDQIIEFASPQSSWYGTHQLSCIDVLGQKSIIIGGTRQRAGLPYSASPSITSGDPKNFVTNSVIYIAGVLCYNIPEQAWWTWSQIGYQATNCFPLAVSQFQLNNSSASTQYMLMCADTVASGLGGYIYKYNVDSYYWSDTLPAGTQSPYPVILQANRMDAGSEMMKKIHKFRLIMDAVYSNPSDTDTNSYIWFFWAKENWNPYDGTSQYRSITIPNTNGRYYIQNLGKARSWACGIASLNKMAMRIRAFEFDISQATR